MSASIVQLLLLAIVAATLPPAGAEDIILGHKCGMPANRSNAAYWWNLNALADILVAGARAKGSAVGAVGTATPRDPWAAAHG